MINGQKLVTHSGLLLCLPLLFADWPKSLSFGNRFVATSFHYGMVHSWRQSLHFDMRASVSAGNSFLLFRMIQRHCNESILSMWHQIYRRRSTMSRRWHVQFMQRVHRLLQYMSAIKSSVECNLFKLMYIKDKINRKIRNLPSSLSCLNGRRKCARKYPIQTALHGWEYKYYVCASSEC